MDHPVLAKREKLERQIVALAIGEWTLVIFDQLAPLDGINKLLGLLLIPFCRLTIVRTGVFEREADGYMSLCPELDIANQGDTVQEARANLVEAVELFFETADPSEISGRVRSEADVTRIDVNVG